MPLTDLQDLWHRRESLSEPEWAHLFGLVNDVLQSARILDGLGREDMIHGFFLDNVSRSRAKSVPESKQKRRFSTGYFIGSMQNQ
jgi:hypothetical protein